MTSNQQDIERDYVLFRVPTPSCPDLVLSGDVACNKNVSPG